MAKRATKILRENRFQFGFSAMELMIAIAILVVIAGLAAPAMKGVLDRSKIKTAASAFQDDIRSARYDSRTYNTSSVTFCSSKSNAKDRSLTCDNSVKFAWGWLWFTGNSLLGKSLVLGDNNVQACTVPFSLQITKGNVAILDKDGAAISPPLSVTFISADDNCASIANANSVVTIGQFGRTTVLHNL